MTRLKIIKEIKIINQFLIHKIMKKSFIVKLNKSTIKNKKFN